MKERIDENGTLYSYATASFYMIYALLALGHSLQSSLIQKAIAGITSYIWKMERGSHLQKLSFDRMGYSFTQLCVTRGPRSERSQDDSTDNNIFIEKTAYKKADWSVHALALTPGGWGFSDVNTTIPDVDDTTAVPKSVGKGVEETKI